MTVNYSSLALDLDISVTLSTEGGDLSRQDVDG